jgi:hypothetical protein
VSGILREGQVKQKTEPVSVKDPDTDEILIPWGTMEEELKNLGLINASEEEINKHG